MPSPSHRAARSSGYAGAASVGTAFVFLAAAALLPLGLVPVYAQNYPVRPIRLIIPFAPGGAADIIGRTIALEMTRTLGQPLVIVNKDGAGTVIGVDAAAKAAPDGYTLLLSGDAAVNNAASGRKLPYDLLRDLAPLSLVYSGAQVLLVQKDSRFNSLQDLVQYAKANPERLKYGSSGVGTSIHLSSEIFNRAAGIRTLHVPYKGVAPAMNDLAGGHVDFVIAGTSVAIPGTKSGLYRALALMSRQRSPLLPQVPTATEQGVVAETGAWYGLFLPSGAPPAVVKKLHGALATALASSEVTERFRSLGGEAMSSSPEELASFVRTQIRKLSPLMRELNIKLE